MDSLSLTAAGICATISVLIFLTAQKVWEVVVAVAVLGIGLAALWI